MFGLIFSTNVTINVALAFIFSFKRIIINEKEKNILGSALGIIERGMKKT